MNGRLPPFAHLLAFVREHLILRMQPRPKQRNRFPGHSFWKLRPASSCVSSHHSSPFSSSMVNLTAFALCTQEQPRANTTQNACKLIRAVPLGVTLGRFLRQQTKLDNLSKLHLRSRLQRFPEARWCVKLDHLCHDNLLDVANSNRPTNPSASDHGTMANLRWSFAGSHMHLSEAGWGDRRWPANCRSMEHPVPVGAG